MDTGYVPESEIIIMKNRRTVEEIIRKAESMGLILTVSNKDIDDYCCFLNDMCDGIYWRENNKVYYSTAVDEEDCYVADVKLAKDVTDSIIKEIKDLQKYM